jgi:hypothetical protein
LIGSPASGEMTGIAGVAVPEDHPPLDELQRQGAAAIINKVIGRAVDAVGPGGECLTVADSLVAAHTSGVKIGVVIDTPHRSAPVTDLITELVTQILRFAPALTGWTITDVDTEELPTPPPPIPGRVRGTRRPRARPGRR